MLGKHIVAGSMFLSNIVLWTEHGYFSASSDSKPLLHLWSLGIEEQFYIFWPVLLYLAWRLRLPIAWLIAGLFALSFSINLFMVERNPTATFYAPYTRAWELLIGAGLAYASIRRPRWLTHVRHSPWQHVLATLGLLAWLAGFLWIHDERAFPGAGLAHTSGRQESTRRFSQAPGPAAMISAAPTVGNKAQAPGNARSS
jgi:peptidoglycan/LPS O-acetylase OafA/YrhL